MDKLYYCKDCKRIVKNELECEYCKGDNTKQLSVGNPVNVIGTKLKGTVLKIKGSTVRLLLRNEANEKYVKEYECEKLRKVL